MSKQVVVYPSGFVGYDVGWPVIRTVPVLDPAAVLQRFSTNATRDKLVISNPVVEQLFTQWRTRSAKTTEAEFIGNIAAAAANAFGTTSFYEWCHMQMSNPYFTAAHRQYLNETLNFLCGKSRTYGYPAWGKMLSVVPATPADKLEHFLYKDIVLSWGNTNTTVLQVINRWMRQPKGIDDLLVFSHLVFGSAD